MTHWSKAVGITGLIASYAVIGALLYARTPATIAAAGYIAAIPDPVVYGVGYYLGSGIGHGGDAPSKIDVFTGLISEFKDEECDPFHPDWAQRCLGVPSPF